MLPCFYTAFIPGSLHVCVIGNIVLALWCYFFFSIYIFIYFLGWSRISAFLPAFLPRHDFATGSLKQQDPQNWNAIAACCQTLFGCSEQFEMFYVKKI